jgi:arginase
MHSYLRGISSSVQKLSQSGGTMSRIASRDVSSSSMPRCRAFSASTHRSNSKGDVSVISVPITAGQPHLGADLAPTLLKEQGLFDILKKCGWNVHDRGNFNLLDIADTGISNAKNVAALGKTCQQVSEMMYECASREDFLLILGGDHSIPLGTIPGIMKARPNTGVVWVDAHADLNTPDSSNSGNMHGMPLAFLMGLLNQQEIHSLPNMQWFEPCLKPSDVVYIGLRDVDDYEKEMIKKLGIKAYTMYDIDEMGIGRVMDDVAGLLHHKDDIHISFDIDALDPFFAPHTGTAVRGGLTFREGNFICERLYTTGKLRSMEIVEVNPELRDDIDSNLTVEMALTLIGSTMGQRIL